MKFLKIITVIIFLFLLLFLLARLYLPHFLAYKKTVDSKNYLIEAWIAAQETEHAAIKYGCDPDARFFITGFDYQDEPDDLVPNFQEQNDSQSAIASEGIWLLSNASLAINLPGQKYETLDTVPIRVNLKGQSAGGYFAFFNVIVNGQYIGGSFSSAKYNDYTFYWNASENKINSFYIRFNNDLKTRSEDRNLNIRSVSIDDSLIEVTPLSSRIVKQTTRSTAGFVSQAAEVANYMEKLGINPKHIHIIDFELTDQNQTLAAATRFKKFADSLSLKSINIISSNLHSRRTWFTYNKMLGNKMDVGIMYFADSKEDNSKSFSNPAFYFHVADEFISYVINWVSLTF